MTSWANIAEKNKNVKIVFKKVEEEKNEENEYIEEIYQIQKKQHFLDNYSQKISDLFFKYKETIENQQALPLLLKLKNSYELQEFIYKHIDYETEFTDAQNFENSEESSEEEIR